MFSGCIKISNEKIVAVSNEPLKQDGSDFLDVGDLVVMPGVIDPHVHVNEPGRTQWEGFDTATKAAIAGGITSLVDMPLNASPVTTTAAALQQKISCTEGKRHCHVGFWGGVVPGNQQHIQPLIDGGVLGFKAFLTHSGIDEFPNVTEDELRLAMPLIAASGLPLLVHSELTDNIERTTPGQQRSYANYLATRPSFWEDDAIALMIKLCREFNCRVHIVHLSSSNSLRQIEAAKQEGLPITVETAQHYLYFNAEDIEDGRTDLKCAPPIRNKENNEQLWQGLQKGTIDFVATDHSPATPDLKELKSGDFLKAWGGIATLQFALPVLWTAAKMHHIPVERMAAWLCEGPARLLGKQLSKGKIAIGYDADIVIWNPEQQFTVTEEMILHKHKTTPYLHQQLYGTVSYTFLNGTAVYKNGKVVSLAQGNIVKPNHNAE